MKKKHAKQNEKRLMSKFKTWDEKHDKKQASKDKKEDTAQMKKLLKGCK